MKIYPTLLAQAQVPTGATATANISPTAKPWTRATSTAAKSHATNVDADGDTKAPSPTAAGSVYVSPTAAGTAHASPTAAGSVGASPTAAGSVGASPTAAGSVTANGNVYASPTAAGNVTANGNVNAGPTAAGNGYASPTAAGNVSASASKVGTPTPSSPTADGFRISIDPLLPVVNVLGGTLDVKS